MGCNGYLLLPYSEAWPTNGSCGHPDVREKQKHRDRGGQGLANLQRVNKSTLQALPTTASAGAVLSLLYADGDDAPSTFRVRIPHLAVLCFCVSSLAATPLHVHLHIRRTDAASHCSPGTAHRHSLPLSPRPSLRPLADLSRLPRLHAVFLLKLRNAMQQLRLVSALRYLRVSPGLWRTGLLAANMQFDEFAGGGEDSGRVWERLHRELWAYPGYPTPPTTVPLVCNTSPLMWKFSHARCSVQSSLLATIYPGRVAATLDRNASAGDALAALWYDRELNGTGVLREQFSCKLANCSQSVDSDGSTLYTCLSGICTCLPNSCFCGGCPSSISLAGILTGLSTTFTMRCAANTTNCNFKFSALDALVPKGFDVMGCAFGECAYPFENPGAKAVSKPLDTSQILGIALGLAFLILLLSLFLFLKISQRRARLLPPPTPSRGIPVSWTDLSYTLPPSGSVGDEPAKRILKDVSGTAKPGELTVLMGPSGSGKTTLLDAVLGRLSAAGEVKGDVKWDGSVVAAAQVRKMCGYVPQHDHLPPLLTVRETLLFSARLCLPESLPLSSLHIAVSRVLAQLKLEHVADELVGDPSSREIGDGWLDKLRRRFGGKVKGRGVSGGERKRVAIGVELVREPGVLILDEPTTGLDSHSANYLMQLLSTMARSESRTIICSIHQPRSDTFKLFDRLVLLANGITIYEGPGSDAEAYFAERGKPCPRAYNIADHLLDIATAGNFANGDSKPLPVALASAPVDPASTAVDLAPPVDSHPGGDENSTYSDARSAPLEDAGRGNRSASMTMARPSADHGVAELLGESEASLHLGELNKPLPTTPGTSTPLRHRVDSRATTRVLASAAHILNPSQPMARPSATFLTQYEVLAWRSYLSLTRDPGMLVTHWVASVLLGIFIGGVYYQSPLTLAGFQNRVGSSFFLLALLGFSSLSALSTVSHLRSLYERELANGHYRPSSLWLSLIIFDLLPLRIIPALVTGTIAYWMIGYVSAADNYFRFLGVLVIFSAATSSSCQLAGIALRSAGTASLLASISMLFAMLFGGVIINNAQIPPVLRWVQYLSFFKYGAEALAVNESLDLQYIDNIANVDIAIPGATVLELLFGFNTGAYTRDVLILMGFWLLIVGTMFIVVNKLRESR
ncbi:hypothetical protein M427DRAFT_30626 [Gonapodya prolifera JEL478]|uniref:ABC transporter domain-containing protein n=1 Tax=Gonapodya prolifera (strain JEL478) TaxID=1344416 RepID=A0A139AK58_GONPJ|nr:hypothetical protein M427DRAFT_30626 [Gonapodya prolifera JEL478]|eukprot:KXS17157.1 hypothetical protein M427DRAFT_30626 [Gonapodya prolifera JEL478]